MHRILRPASKVRTCKLIECREPSLQLDVVISPWSFLVHGGGSSGFMIVSATVDASATPAAGDPAPEQQAIKRVKAGESSAAEARTVTLDRVDFPSFNASSLQAPLLQQSVNDASFLFGLLFLEADVQ